MSEDPKPDPDPEAPIFPVKPRPVQEVFYAKGRIYFVADNIPYYVNVSDQSAAHVKKSAKKETPFPSRQGASMSLPTKKPMRFGPARYFRLEYEDEKKAVPKPKKKAAKKHAAKAAKKKVSKKKVSKKTVLVDIPMLFKSSR